jgi:hypothetical protein
MKKYVKREAKDFFAWFYWPFAVFLFPIGTVLGITRQGSPVSGTGF